MLSLFGGKKRTSRKQCKSMKRKSCKSKINSKRCSWNRNRKGTRKHKPYCSKSRKSKKKSKPKKSSKRKSPKRKSVKKKLVKKTYGGMQSLCQRTHQEYDIKKCFSIPTDNYLISSGMCGGCITITFYLENDTLVVAHYLSCDSDNEEYNQDFFTHIMQIINNVHILEIRIFAPTDIGNLENEKISANGVLKSLQIIKIMNFKSDQIIFIEGKTSNHTFWKDVNQTTTYRANSPEQEEQAKIIYGEENIIIYMDEVLVKQENIDVEKKIVDGKKRTARRKEEEARRKEEEARRKEEEARQLEIIKSHFTNLAQEDLEKYDKDEITLEHLNERLVEIRGLEDIPPKTYYKKSLRDKLENSTINLILDGWILKKKNQGGNYKQKYLKYKLKYKKIKE
jgi:hypothetical protein